VHLLSGARGDSSEIGRISDEIGGRCEGGTYLRGLLIAGARAKTDHRHPARRAGVEPRQRVVDGAGHHDHREVGHRRCVDIGDSGDPLLRGARPLDIPRFPKSARCLQGRTDPFEGAAEFEHRDRRSTGEVGDQLVGGRGSGQHHEALLALDQWNPEGRARARYRGDARDDLGGKPWCQTLVHVHVGAEEKRIALGE